MLEVWVRSDITAAGNYVATVDYGHDQSRTLTRDDAFRYVTAVVTAAQQADYDAAVLTQLVEATEMPVGEAVKAVEHLRSDRTPIDDDATRPLTLTPGVSAMNHRPFLHIHVDGRLVGQWTPADAQQHAGQVLTVLHTVGLDAAYYRWLTDMGVEPDRARSVVEDVGNWMTP